MTTVDSTARLAALIRSQVSTLQRRPPREKAGKAQSSKSARETPKDLASVLAHRLDAIDRGDPRREQKAARIYLESVFLAELGLGLGNDPAFAVMVDQVFEQMMGDPRLSRDLTEAATLLLGSSAA